jgi:hypothetical protein
LRRYIAMHYILFVYFCDSVKYLYNQVVLLRKSHCLLGILLQKLFQSTSVVLLAQNSKAIQAVLLYEGKRVYGNNAFMGNAFEN